MDLITLSRMFAAACGGFSSVVILLPNMFVYSDEC